MAMQVFERNAEVKLVEALNSVSDPSGWYALHFHLNNLMEQFKSDYQIKIAVNLINDLLKNFDGGVFVLQDSSIIVVAYGLEKALQNKLVFQLRYLYMDDPLAYDDDGQENPAFCSGYNLGQDWQKFMDLSTRRMAMTLRKPAGSREAKIEKHIVEQQTVKSGSVATEVDDGSFSALRLAGVEGDLKQLSVGDVIRRQPICAMQAGLPPRKLFDELYINIAHLREVVKADVDFLSNRWLFRYLTQILDTQMLGYLMRERETYLRSPISLNLNVETLFSETFQKFDQSLKQSSKSGIVLEIPVVDVFADMTGFILARKEVQKLGYRVCLDGITSDSFNHIQRDKLGVDLVKVQWNLNVSEKGSKENQEVSQAVRATGANRIILCRCDNKDAIDFGHSVGIALFQGRYVDSVVNPSNQIKN